MYTMNPGACSIWVHAGTYAHIHGMGMVHFQSVRKCVWITKLVSWTNKYLLAHYRDKWPASPAPLSLLFCLRHPPPHTRQGKEWATEGPKGRFHPSFYFWSRCRKELLASPQRNEAGSGAKLCESFSRRGLSWSATWNCGTCTAWSPNPATSIFACVHACIPPPARWQATHVQTCAQEISSYFSF